MQLKIRLEGETPSKKNRWAIGKHGRIYTPAAVTAWTDHAVYLIRAQCRKQQMPGKIGLEAKIYVQRSKDLDNLLGSIMDALQKSGVVLNDGHIVEIKANRYKADKLQRPHVDLVLYDVI